MLRRDFLPFGYEKDVTTTCSQNYKFEGVDRFGVAHKEERDTETNNDAHFASRMGLRDDFGARYYSSRLARWLSADWSSVPAPVPYANLTNPQTLNLYAMVSDNPESFTDLDGHVGDPNPPVCTNAGGPELCNKPQNGNQVTQDQNSESSKKRTEIKEETYATVYKGQSVIALDKTTTTTTTDANGEKHITMTSTTAYFSTEQVARVRF